MLKGRSAPKPVRKPAAPAASPGKAAAEGSPSAPAAATPASSPPVPIAGASFYGTDPFVPSSLVPLLAANFLQGAPQTLWDRQSLFLRNSFYGESSVPPE